MIKAIALDIDGTLINSKKVITAATKTAVSDAISRGIEIIIASGRPYCGVVSYARQLGLYENGGYILSFNGGQIINCKTGEIVYEVHLCDEHKYEICSILKDYDKAIAMTYKGDVLLSENVEDAGVLHGARVNSLTLQKVDDLSENLEHTVGKFILMGEPGYIKSIADELAQRLGDMATVCRSESNLLEIMPYGVDKGSALAGFVKKMGLDRSQVMACGDAYNDDTMIEFAGIGVAMGNAFEEIKALADYVTFTNDEDGVAHAIRKFAL